MFLFLLRQLQEPVADCYFELNYFSVQQNFFSWAITVHYNKTIEP